MVHPPPTYQILEGRNFVICNFVPRPLEFHPQAIKVPYYHPNVDSDEVIFYHAGESAARKGYTHALGRQAYLDSPTMTESSEMAFMVDTFNPLEVGEGGRVCDGPSYAWHWSGRGPLTRVEGAEGTR